MNKPLVSIVMPVYKTEEFIEESIKSVLNQVYSNIELICINDGTPDLAFDICKEYQVKDSKIKVLDNGENKGLEYTRNQGIKRALGKYIMFLDSDDILDKNMIESMVEIAEKNSTDIVLSTYSMIINKKEQPVLTELQTIEKIGTYEFSKLLLDKIEWKIITCVGTKLYKAEVIRKYNIRFEKKYKYNEDGGFIFSYLLMAKSISFINKPYYKYTIRDSGSIMSSYRRNLFSHLVKVNELLKELFIKSNIYNEKKELYYKKLFFVIIDVIKNEVKFGSRKTFFNVLKLIENYDDYNEMKQYLKNSKLLGIQQKYVFFLIYFRRYRILYWLTKYKIRKNYKIQIKNLYYIFWTKYYENKYQLFNKGNLIFMFHEIVEEETNPSHFKTNKNSFEIFIKNLLKEKKAVSLKEIIKNNKAQCFAITFDDVYENFYTNAYPILKKYNIPFTIFVASNLIGKKDFLTKYELEILSKDELCTIGAHTINHVRLRTEKNSYNEIKKSKDILSEMLNKEISYFAYPYGSIYACSNKNIREVKKTGYEAAFSTIKGVVPKNVNKYRYFLPRINGDHLVKEIEEREE